MLKKRYSFLFRIIAIICSVSLLSCNKNKTVKINEEINIRDSIAAEKLFQLSHDEHIKDTIGGPWSRSDEDTSPLESCFIVLKKYDNDSISGTYFLMKQGKIENGLITGHITGKKAEAEFHDITGSPQDKGKIELVDWNKGNYETMKINLIESPKHPSFFPDTLILSRKASRKIQRELK